MIIDTNPLYNGSVSKRTLVCPCNPGITYKRFKDYNKHMYEKHQTTLE